MQAINYVIRDGAGRVSRGDLSADQARVTLDAMDHADISLNIGRDDVDNYRRIGNDLLIQLEDGREILIENIFVVEGEQTARLYFSENGEIQEISFTESWGRTNQARFEATDHPTELVFSDGVALRQPAAVFEGAVVVDAAVANTAASWGTAAGSTAAASFDGGLLTAGLIGAGLLMFSGGGGGSSAPAALSGQIFITEIGSGDDLTVNAVEYAAGPTVSGRTEENIEVTVTLGGVSVTTMSDAQGVWNVNFNPGTISAGEYSTQVTATATSGTGLQIGTTLDVNFDTFAEVAIDVAGTENYGIVLLSDTADGVTIVGTSQPGSEVNVTLQGVTLTATVAEDGSWTATFGASTVVGINDEFVNVTATTTDAVGNTSSVTQSLRVDTVIDVEFDTIQMTDNVINETEAQNTLVLTGATNPGATVVVEIDGNQQTATVDGSGNWTVSFSPTVIPDDVASLTIEATATDVLGNSSTVSHIVSVDTSGFVYIDAAPIEIDNVVNLNEAQDGVVIMGTTQPGSSVVVEFHTFTGAATVDENGHWTIEVPAGQISDGEYEVEFTATATSSTGNIDVATSTVDIDTLVNELSLQNNVVAGDNTISAAEMEAGVVLSGRVEIGSTVEVTIQGVTRTATVGNDGVWTVTFANGDLPEGEYQTQMMAVATDAVGNTSTITQAVAVDTVGVNVELSSVPLAGDNTINATEVADGLEISGTGDPNVELTITFGYTTTTTTVGEDGTWTVTLTPEELGSGTFDTALVITTDDGAGNVTEVTQDVTVDTEVTDTTFPTNVISDDGVLNGAEVGSAFTIEGTAEVGSTVVVTIAGVGYPADVADDGTWSLVVDANTFGDGEYSTEIIATTTDAADNSVSHTATVEVDTLVNRLNITSTSMDGETVLNSFVAQAGIHLSGTVEAGSTVEVTFEGTTRTAFVDDSGNWAVTFSGSDVPAGEYTTTATVVATDAAGNTATASSDFTLDTAIPVAPEITAVTEGLSGIRSIAMPLSSDDYTINAVAEDGTVYEVSYNTMFDTSHNEIVFSFAADLPDGTDLIVELNDEAGNQSSTLFVLDDNPVVDMGSATLADFEIEAVDLVFASDSQLTITAEQLENLSGLSDSLLIRGEEGDTVTALGATATTETREIDGELYDIYTLGDNGAYLVIDQDIDVLT